MAVVARPESSYSGFLIFIFKFLLILLTFRVVVEMLPKYR